jgi:hypothetical protein
MPGVGHGAGEMRLFPTAAADQRSLISPDLLYAGPENTAPTPQPTQTDKDGKSARAVVALVRTASGGRVLPAESEDDGVAGFDRVPPGVYKLLAWDDIEPGAWDDPGFRKPYEPLAVQVTISPGQRQTAEVPVQHGIN